MPDYSASETVDILLVLGECQRSYRRAAALYRRRYPRRLHHPNHAAIRAIERRCRRGNIGRQRRRYTIDNYGMNPRCITVLAMVHLNPHISLRGIQTQVGIPRETARRYLKLAKFHPYHVSLKQALTEQDHEQRRLFCQWAIQQVRDDENFFKYVMFSDESTFCSDGLLNRHNSHYWSPVNPHWMQQIDHQHRWSVNVWCGIVNGYLIGPYFFEGTVNSINYLNLLREVLPRLLENVDLETRMRMWFQQDGAPPHFANVVRNYLNETYPGKWIGRGGPTGWPARSPDLTSPDFYLWGFLKDAVYRERPTTKANMIQKIQVACESIPRATLLGTVSNFHRRLQLCLQENGATFEHLIS